MQVIVKYMLENVLEAEYKKIKILEDLKYKEKLDKLYSNMPFPIQRKSNFIYLGIILLLAISVGMGILFYSDTLNKPAIGQMTTEIVQKKEYGGLQAKTYQDENLPSEFTIKSTNLGETTSDENGVVAGTLSNLSSLSPGMHVLKFQGIGENGKPLTKRRFINIPGKPQIESIYGVYFNIFNPKNDSNASEIIDVIYNNEDYATLSPDENGGIFVQFQITKNQDKFEATAKSRNTGKTMKVSVGVDKIIPTKANQLPIFEKVQTTNEGYFVIVNDDQVANMPIGVFPGKQIHIKLGPYKPNSQVSTHPYYNLGTFTSDENGIVDELITMPDLAPGAHEITFDGECSSGVGIGLNLNVFYPGNPRIDSYMLYLAGFTPYDENIDYDDQVIKFKYEYGNENFFSSVPIYDDYGEHPDEDGGVFVWLPIFSNQGKFKFIAEEKLTGKTVEISMDIIN